MKDKIKDLERVLELIDKSDEIDEIKFENPDLDKLSIVAGLIKSEPYSKSTQRERRVALSAFYRLMYPSERNRPEWVHDVLKHPVTDTRKIKERDRTREYEFITPRELLQMVDVAQTRNRRDPAILMAMYESGARSGTIRDTRYGDAEVKEDCIEITLRNEDSDVKFTERTVYLTKSYHVLREWIESGHPKPEDDDAPLFCRLPQSASGAGAKITPKALSDIIHKAAVESGLTKRHNPHAFRKCMATYLYKVCEENWTFQEIKERGGWAENSQVVCDNYLLDASEVKGNRRKRRQKQTDVESKGDRLTYNTCGCGEDNPPTRKDCRICAGPLREVEILMDNEKEAFLIETEGQQGLSQTL